MDAALERLGQMNARLRDVVELRFFAGLTEEQTGKTLQVTARTVRRDWIKARAFLYKELYAGAGMKPAPPQEDTASAAEAGSGPSD